MPGHLCKQFLLRCIKFLHFSIIHLAIQHGREQLLIQVLQLMEQLDPAEKSLIDIKNQNGHVSDL